MRQLLIMTIVCLATNVASADPPLSVPAPPRGTLFIAGGGLLGDDVMNPFIKLIGGDEGKLVVVTTANSRAEEAPDEIVAMWTARTKAKLTLLHARSADEANSEAFVAPLKQATGVWLMSGRQSRLTAAYLGTRLLTELKAHLDRGGVIGGSSAGAAVMTDVMLSGGTLEQPGVYEGFGLLPGSIVDQHFLMRKREPRLLYAMQKHPGRVGFGIDESTALVVQGRKVQVVGQSSVSVFLPACASRPLSTKILKAGDREDLTALCRAAVARCCDPFPPAKPETPVLEKGSLVIVGGEPLPPSVQSKFIELAGGPSAKIVVVPTAHEQAATDLDDVRWLKQAGAKNVEVLHPQSRDEANSDAFVARLRDAGGVWFGGGRQWRIIDAFEGTKAYQAFHDVLARGGVIGGSSAGATIQGDYLVRGSPLGNTQMMAEGYERGFGFLGGTAIDQHFTQGKRQPDMELLKRTFPQLLGLGLDEGTAVVVRGSKLEVLGDATVSIYPPAVAPTVRPVSARPAEPAAAVPQVLKSGDAYDLSTFRTLQAAE